jgi:hypothetical protein
MIPQSGYIQVKKRILLHLDNHLRSIINVEANSAECIEALSEKCIRIGGEVPGVLQKQRNVRGVSERKLSYSNVEGWVEVDRTSDISHDHGSLIRSYQQ